MSSIDSKPLHSKNKLLLYSRYVLSKLSWDFTISNIPQTWIKENIDSLVNSYIRRCLEIPVSGTLPTIFMTRNKFGLNIIPPSVKFLQCQTILRNALKSSPNVEINELWNSASTNRNIQYDVYTTTKEVIKDFRAKQENKLQNKLSMQGSFFKSISNFALPKLTKLWSVAQSSLPKKFLVSVFDTLITLYLLVKTYFDGTYPPLQIAVTASSAKLSSMSLLGHVSP